MLDTKLLEILCCPKCKGQLEYQPDEQDDRNGSLVCHQCKLEYAVEENIPNMVVEQAKAM